MSDSESETGVDRVMIITDGGTGDRGGSSESYAGEEADGGGKSPGDSSDESKKEEPMELRAVFIELWWQWRWKIILRRIVEDRLSGKLVSCESEAEKRSSNGGDDGLSSGGCTGGGGSSNRRRRLLRPGLPAGVVRSSSPIHPNLWPGLTYITR